MATAWKKEKKKDRAYQLVHEDDAYWLE